MEMNLIEVNIICLQSPEAFFAGSFDVVSGEVWLYITLNTHFRGDIDLFTEGLYSLSQNLLGVPIGLRSVKEVNSKLIGMVNHPLKFFEVFSPIDPA